MRWQLRAQRWGPRRAIPCRRSASPEAANLVVVVVRGQHLIACDREYPESVKVRVTFATIYRNLDWLTAHSPTATGRCLGQRPVVGPGSLAPMANYQA